MIAAGFAVWCRVMQHGAVRCSVWQCGVALCSVAVRVTVCNSSALMVHGEGFLYGARSVLQRAAVCCDVLQCTVVCCTLSQCIFR